MNFTLLLKPIFDYPKNQIKLQNLSFDRQILSIANQRQNGSFQYLS